jgi:hypothetical protein
VRDAGADVQVVRTVHHVDDFTTQALVDCQRQAILERWSGAACGPAFFD